MSAAAIDLSHYELLPIFLVSLALILAASEAGRQFGVRAKTRGGDNISTLEGAILGLLALMISFTFAMALSRFEARRDAVLEEANAIGTTALRARLLPAPHGAETLKLLREYVQLRLDVAQGTRSGLESDAVIARSNALHEALWQQAKVASAKALNEMIDHQEKRLTAIRNRVPNVVLLALYGIATVASAFTGYAGGLEARRSRLPVYTMGILVDRK